MRGNVKATIAIILLLGVIATAIIAVISDGFTLPVEEWGAKFDIKDNVDEGQVDDDKTPGTDNEDQDTPDDVDPETPGTGGSTPSVSGGGVTDENGNYLDQDGVSPMPQAMAFSVDETDGNGSVTIIASIEPSDATNNDIAWDVQFVDPDSEWATGKTVTDYVTILPDSAGYSGVCTVTCHQAFGEQIIVTAQSVANPDVKQSCTVDYKQRVTDVWSEINGKRFDFEDNDNPFYSVGYLLQTTTEANFQLAVDQKGELYQFEIKYDTTAVYTQPINFNIYYTNSYCSEDMFYPNIFSYSDMRITLYDFFDDQPMIFRFDREIFSDPERASIRGDVVGQLSYEKILTMSNEDLSTLFVDSRNGDRFTIFNKIGFKLGEVEYRWNFDIVLIPYMSSLDILDYYEYDDEVVITNTKADVMLSSITIPSSVNDKPVTGIGILAKAQIEEQVIIDIPQSVTKMDSRLFAASSFESLTINYDGTIAEWEQNLPSAFYTKSDNCDITLNCQDGTISLEAKKGGFGNGSVIEGEVFQLEYYKSPLVMSQDPEGFYIVGLTEYGQSLSTIEIYDIDTIYPIIGIKSPSIIQDIFPDECNIKLMEPLLIEGTPFSNVNIVYLRIDDTVESLEGYLGEHGVTIDTIEFTNDVVDICDDMCSNFMNISEVVIPESVKTIGKRAFYNCHLTSIKIPGNVVTIGEDAFRGNALSSIIIEEGVKNINAGAFKNNPYSEVIIKGGDITIASDAFDKNFINVKVTLNYNTYANSGLTDIIGTVSTQDLTLIISPDINVVRHSHDYIVGKIEFADGTTAISGDFSGFNNCDVVIIPQSVSYISSSLHDLNYTYWNKKLYYYGTEEEWSAVDFETPAGKDFRFDIYCNYDPNEEAS